MNASAHRLLFSREWFVASVVAFVLAGLLFAASHHLEFASGSENLVVATALESHRTGEWLLPTLNEQPRIKKPPLPMWWTAVFMLPAVNDGNANLEFWTRLSTVPLVVITLLSTYGLARVLRCSSHWSLLAMLVCGSSLMFSRFARSATVDIHLMTWVALASFAWMLALRRKTIAPAMLAGAALGLAFMSKGPVALLQCGVPMLLMTVILKLPLGNIRQWLVGAACFSVIAFPWFVVVFVMTRGVANTWMVELHRRGATPFGADSPLTYLQLFLMVFPWTVFFVVGLIDGAKHLRRRGGTHAGAIALLLVVVPVVVMTLFPDRKDRYLLPMIVPASVVVVQGCRLLARHHGRFNGIDKAVVVIQSVTLIGASVAMVVALWGVALWGVGSPLAGVVVATAMFSISVAGIVMTRRNVMWLLLATALVGLGATAVSLNVYSTLRQGKSELKPLAMLIRSQVSDAQVIHVNPQGLFLAPNDLAIYLNQTVTIRIRIEDVPAEAEQIQVLVVQQEKGEPEPAFAGWRVLGKTPRDNDFYWAFVREVD
jgi:4-amino-4-deoxy-L-arabinose transferase-like glycosyltransferase